ncbi:hypothetical protein [Catellatospora paridis]|uniref:hypothetical protein n=1 Tax=Catellatospora paridis TaxID=1617086 RepID=UPI0012D3EFFD|nr:hypothetical protein [Catellatospora paridis]
MKGIDAGFVVVTVTEPEKVTGNLTVHTPYVRDFMLRADSVVSMRGADECERPYD